jgi:zinc transporter
MYTLSLVAVIFLPLTFMTGLLGMNVGGLPGVGNPWGFYIACATMVTIGICTIIYFKNTKWL